MAPADSPATAGLAAVEYGYPLGHLGHLTEEEQTALDNFKVYLANENLYKPGPPPSHDDILLLRFLRARKWVLPEAAKQFKDTEEWRRDIQIDVLYDTIDVEAYDESRQLYPQWTGRRDRRGIPVYLFEIKHLDNKTIARYEKSVATTYSKAAPPKDEAKNPAKLIRLFALYENLTRFVQPLCTQLTDREHERTSITLSTNIVDVSGVSLKGFWNLKGHMQLASQLATAHYPETLDRIFILGAPIFFSTVWGWIKRWFDPVTVSKIFILSQSEVLPVLTSYIDIKNIPKAYGGELDFNWCDMPNLDPKIKAFATWENGFTEFPKGPLYWVPIGDDGKRLECLAKGSIDKKERSVRVCTIPVAFPEGEKEEDKEVKKEEVVPAVEDEKPEETAVVDSKDAPLSPGSPAEDEFEDAPEQPLEPAAVVETTGLQNLSLQEIDEKKPEEPTVSEKAGEIDAIGNGKPVVAS